MKFTKIFCHIVLLSLMFFFSMQVSSDNLVNVSSGEFLMGDNFNEGLLLSFDSSTTLDWMGYSLDGAANITIQGNTTIPMPDEGYHSIQVSGTVSTGIQYQSDVRHFTVKNETISES